MRSWSAPPPAARSARRSPVGAPTVKIGAASLDGDAAVAAPAYRFARAVDAASETEGTSAVLVTLTDLAGNSSVVSLGTATYDFTPPAVVAGSAGVTLVPAA